MIAGPVIYLDSSWTIEIRDTLIWNECGLIFYLSDVFVKTLLNLCRVCLKILKHSKEQYDHGIIPIVHSFLLHMSEVDLHVMQSGICNASCIRFHLVKLLRKAGYDASVCSTKWQRSGNVPGGMLFS